MSLSTLLEEYSESLVTQLCQTFRCAINKDLELFLNDPNKAISFEKRNITKTYLYFSKEKEIVAYFTVSLNVLETKNITKTTIKKIDGIDKNRQEIACFLIAQLGKSDTCTRSLGAYLLSDAIETIKDASDIVGGRIIVLDAIYHPKVITFYEEYHFVRLEQSNEFTKNIKMYYPLFV